MFPRKIFENLHTVITLSLLFEQFLRQILLKFFAHNSESLPKCDAFSLRSFNLCVLIKRKA